MRSEKYWVKALDQTHLSITNNGLFPLKTTVVTREYYNKNDFINEKRKILVIDKLV